MKPSLLGLPDRYTEWRPRQEDALYASAGADERFVAMVAPTGFGKSLVYLGEALLRGARAVVLTSTKALEAQLMRDFESAGLFNINGRNNYDCRLDLEASSSWARRDHPLRVDEGVCNFGQDCLYKARGCTYYDAYRKAVRRNLLVTNYTYWFTIHTYGEGLGKFDLLICDEAHDAADKLADFLTVKLSHKEVRDYGIDAPPPDPTGWHEWAHPHAVRISASAEELVQELGSLPGSRRTALREAKHQRELARRLFTVSSFKGEWIMDQDDYGYRWDTTWPTPYTEEHLFRGIRHVLLVSATIRPKTLDVLGIGGVQTSFLEYPSSFPVSRRPIYVVPTVRLNNNTLFFDLRKWVARIDEIIDGRLDRKGIVHTVSYARRDYLFQNSRHRARFITHDKKGLTDAVERFKAAGAGTILLSPSVTTGYDFPYQECEYAIISKMPYPSLGSKVVLARRDADKAWYAYATAQEVEQTAGRGMRHADDQCEVFIVDDAFKYLWYNRGLLFTRAFKEAVRLTKVVPRPPKALTRTY